jgi:small-conductance mechanosensitive channel
VQFEDFGSDALLFGLYVWIELKQEVSWTVVASDLRYMIYRTMSEHGIDIAFPQRDIHINTSEPLEVRVLTDKPNAGGVKE